VLKEIMLAPDQAIPKDVLDSAECVAVFPQVIKAGFIVGGRGVASCRLLTAQIPRVMLAEEEEYVQRDGKQGRK
jgi:lipid-binding SYLF domain-containing protein